VKNDSPGETEGKDQKGKKGKTWRRVGEISAFAGIPGVDKGKAVSRGGCGVSRWRTQGPNTKEGCLGKRGERGPGKGFPIVMPKKWGGKKIMKGRGGGVRWREQLTCDFVSGQRGAKLSEEKGRRRLRNPTE